MNIRIRKKGFTLVETALVLSISVFIGFVAFSQLVKGQEVNKAQYAGDQIKMIGESVNAYISNHYDVLSTLSNATGTSSDLGPRTCNTATGSCTITIATLMNEGLLPSSYSGKNVYGYGYNILLKRSGTAPYYKVTGMVLTDTSLGTGSNIRYDLLGQAMQKAGIDSGMTNNSSSVVSGFNGSWTANNSDFSNINKIGLLAYQAGYGTYNYSVFLRRDGTLPMTGNLNMGSNSINNAVDYNGSGNMNTGGTITSGGIITAGGKIYAGDEITAKNGYGDTIALGGDAAGNDYELRLGTNKQLTVYSPNSTQYSTVLRVNRNSIINERLATNGLDPNDVPAGWAGGLRTMDVYANGTIATAYNGNLAAYMNGAGTIYSSNDILAQHAIYTRDSTGTIVKAYMNSDGTIYASGNMQVDGNINANGNINTYANITASKRLTTGEYLQVYGTASLNGTCSSNGLVARDGSGSPLNCINGKWAKASYNISSYSVSFTAAVGASGDQYQRTNMGSHLFCYLSGIQTADGLTKHNTVYLSGGSWILEQRVTIWPNGINTWAQGICLD